MNAPFFFECTSRTPGNISLLPGSGVESTLNLALEHTGLEVDLHPISDGERLGADLAHVAVTAPVLLNDFITIVEAEF